MADCVTASCKLTPDSSCCWNALFASSNRTPLSELESGEPIAVIVEVAWSAIVCIDATLALMLCRPWFSAS